MILYDGVFQGDHISIVRQYSVMQMDATPRSHPIIVKYERPENISTMFDSITYSKVMSLAALHILKFDPYF